MAVLLFGTPASVTTQQARGPATAAIYRGVGTAVRFDISPPLRELALKQPVAAAGVEDERFDDPPSGLEGPLGPQGRDPIVQDTAAFGGREMPTAAQNFDGMSQASGPYPPDPVGDVGPDHYVQMVNSRYAVYSKTGTLLAGPALNNTLWAGLGGACETENAGDPIVLYDQIANRWLLTQFTAAGPTYYNCVALSTGADPTGTYYRWAFSTGTNFPDYPKYGIWSDAYYISTREFSSAGPFAGVGAYALNKAQMLAGNPSPQIISFLALPSPSYSVGDGLLPTDLDGTTLPPADTPNFFIGSRDNGGPYGAPSDALNIWKFTVDFATPASSSFVLANTVAVTEFDSMLSACSGRNCVPQPGTTQKLDHQGYRQRVLHRAAYRNFGPYESIVTNQSVEVPTAMSGIRWWEIRSPNSSPTINQEGTYAPGSSDGVHRWFGSVAQDQSGNMALGYSASNGTATYPSVRYTGRLAGDPLGNMAQSEATLVAGAGSQTGTAARWGDYSSMNVDPVDDCTFWYTTEYYATTSVTGWRTRIGSFKFPSCTSVPTPAPVANGSSLTSEGYCPLNNEIDPGERVTVSLTVKNNGTGPSSNLVGTLQNTGGVTGASGPQTYGAIAAGGSVSRSVSFTASGTCGGAITATLHLQDGAADLGNITYTFTLGALVTTTSFSETFDGVTAPALPSGWTTAATDAESPWVTSTTSPFSAPNAAFAPDPGSLGHTELVTPTIAVPAAGAQLSFKNNYMTESGWDGMVLEISIDGGAFADITTGGNAFISGGYNLTLNAGSALGGRQAWSGNSGGYITSSINLPAAALGHNVQLKWRMASDSIVGATGVRIDSITVGTSSYGCSLPCPGGAAGDFTGDLKSDILWRHATRGEVWLWPMDGAARTAETLVRTVSDTDFEIRGVGDQNGDGKADILWRNKTNGQIYFWPMDGSTPLSETYVATVDPAYDIVGTGDYDGDGKSDILWRHLTNGDLWMWLMNGATPLAETYVATVDPGYVVKGSGDLNGDKKADIVWHHATTGDVWVWLMNGTIRASETFVGAVPDVGYQIVGVADHTGDGKADLLWHHATRGEVWIWPMNGTTVVSESYVDTVPDTGYQIVGSGDYNGDTKADILWHHATRGEVWVWLMNGVTKVSETWVATVPEIGYQIVKVK
jgi:hypothetical protein